MDGFELVLLLFGTCLLLMLAVLAAWLVELVAVAVRRPRH